MEVLYERCAGLDVHKRSVTVCVRRPGKGRRRQGEVRTFATYRADLAELAAWLAEERVSHVAMEATGVFWRPVWRALEGRFELLLVNPTHVKTVPGRKTDVADAEWLARLLECGLLAASFVPPPEVRRLRDLTRYRKRLIQTRVQESQRIEKVLEDAGVKLAAVASDHLGVSGRAMLDALVAGARDPEVLAEMARGRLRRRIPDLRKALDGAFDAHHGAMVAAHLERVDALDAAIMALDERVDEAIAPWSDQRDRLQTIPGVGKLAAEVIIAETGADMGRFPTSGHLASWAGMCPGNRESAGKHQPGRLRHGDPWLRGVLTECGWSARRTRGTYLAARFWNVAGRRGKERAAIATGHSILIAAWHILADPSASYVDLGPDWFARRATPEARTRQLVRQLQALGHEVLLQPATTA